MSETEQPEASSSRKPGQGADAQPDLTIRDWKGSKVPPESDGENQGQPQSVFSARSGIQDPLIKPAPEAEEAKEAEASESPEAEAEPVVPSPADPAGKPTRKPRKGKGEPGKKKLAKSKRQLDRARRRQENYLQKRRRQKKLEVFYGRIRHVLKMCLAVFWFVLLCEMVNSSLWLFNPPRFEVENHHLLQPLQLNSLIKPWVGKPLYTIDTGVLARQIETQFELVDRAVVRRQLFPARLTIQLFEKRPWAELYVPAAYDKVQQAQKEAEKAGKAEPAIQMLPYGVVAQNALISLKGYQYSSALYPDTAKILVNPKTTLSEAYLNRLREIIWQAGQIKGLHLEVVDIRDVNRVILRYREVPVILGALNNSASTRLARLVPLLPKINEYHDIIEAVDLKWEEQATFHKKPNAQLKKPAQEQVQG